MSTALDTVRNRIVGYDEVDPSTLTPHPHNWRTHPDDQRRALAGALTEVGYVGAVLVNRLTGNLLDGHARREDAIARGQPTLPVLYVEVDPSEEAVILATLDPIGAMAGTSREQLTALMDSIAGAPPANLDLADFLVEQRQQQEALLSQVEQAAIAAGAKELVNEPRTRGSASKASIDMIVALGTHAMAGTALVTCCLAVKCGFLYGFQTSMGACRNASAMRAHRPAFIDNHFKAYDHAYHASVVAEWKPKYATVRDLMTRKQCDAAGIEYYDFDTIMRWAEDLEQHAQHVIVIPKYDCLSEIPERYVLGYSIPTAYGGTPLDLDRFRGRPVHLLGGQPNQQIAYWHALPGEVVSLDNNAVVRAANYGHAWCQDGRFRSLTELGFTAVSSPFFLAVTISYNHLMAYFGRSADDPGEIAEEVAMAVEREEGSDE